MAGTKNELPEGTDTIIEGASGASNLRGTNTDTTDDLITGGDDMDDNDSRSESGIRGMLSTSASKIRDEAGTRTRGFVSQGLERGSGALGNISSLIGDTVDGIEEKLGPQYADYARQASQTIQRYADNLSEKDPDELMDDARELVRKSPGVALAGAAIVGFGLVRLVKAGLEDNSRNSGGKNRKRKD